MRTVILIVLMAIICGSVQTSAQFTTLGAGGKSGTGTPTTPCNAGQLDFQDACGTTQYMVILR